VVIIVRFLKYFGVIFAVLSGLVGVMGSSVIFYRYLNATYSEDTVSHILLALMLIIIPAFVAAGIVMVEYTEGQEYD